MSAASGSTLGGGSKDGVFMLPGEASRFFLQKAQAGQSVQAPRGKCAGFPRNGERVLLHSRICCGAHLPSPRDLAASCYPSMQGRFAMALQLCLEHAAPVLDTGVLGRAPSFMTQRGE